MCQQKVPLLRKGKERAAKSFVSLYTTAFLRTFAYATATLPAFALHMYELTLACGSDPSSAAWSLGVASALRYFAEFAGSQVLVGWSWNFGCRPVLLASCAALALESALMAAAPTPFALGAVHVLGGLAFSAGGFESHCIAISSKSSAREEDAREGLACAMGAAFVVGPCLGGVLGVTLGSTAPFYGALAASLVAMATVLMRLPEYMPKGGKASHVMAAPRGTQAPRAGRCSEQERASAWYCCALALNAVGMAAFASTSALWMRVALRWDDEHVGGYFSIGGSCQLFARLIFLPRVMQMGRGCETRSAQWCLGITAARFIALASCFDGNWTHSILFLSTPGFCGTPLLTALCLGSPRGKQGGWSVNLPALNSAASAVGALIGSLILARALADPLPTHASVSAPLLFAAAAHFLAGACVASGKQASEQVVELDV